MEAGNAGADQRVGLQRVSPMRTLQGQQNIFALTTVLQEAIPSSGQPTHFFNLLQVVTDFSSISVKRRKDDDEQRRQENRKKEGVREIRVAKIRSER